MIPLDFLSRAQKETIQSFTEGLPTTAAGVGFQWKVGTEFEGVLFSVAFDFLTNATAGNRYVGLAWYLGTPATTQPYARTHSLSPQTLSQPAAHAFCLHNSPQTALINSDVGHEVLPLVWMPRGSVLVMTNDGAFAGDVATNIVITGIRWKAYPKRYNVSVDKSR